MAISLLTGSKINNRIGGLLTFYLSNVIINIAFINIFMKEFFFPNQTGYYKGKVRDVYSIKNEWVVMKASDRISAFDVILPKEIPFKGQVLNQIAAYMLEACKDICPVWLVATPTPNVSLGKLCIPFKVEVVVRGYLTGHAWREYKAGKRMLCGVPMTEGLNENDAFLTPIITPSTKADEGHDEDITEKEILERHLATKDEWEVIKKYALQLFERGQLLASKQDLILVDTKYEFGKSDNEITLMDEIHTPDSSRYFIKSSYLDNQEKGLPQRQLSKEFVREWLIQNDFMGKPGQIVPEMSKEWVEEISQKYIELYERLVGVQFLPQAFTHEETETNVLNALKILQD